MKRNLTIQLDEKTVQRARVIAARQSTSISKLVAEVIERVAAGDNSLEQARQEALTYLDKSFSMGAQQLPSRDSLHER